MKKRIYYSIDMNDENGSLFPRFFTTAALAELDAEVIDELRSYKIPGNSVGDITIMSNGDTIKVDPIININDYLIHLRDERTYATKAQEPVYDKFLNRLKDML